MAGSPAPPATRFGRGSRTNPTCGPDGGLCLTIKSDHREGLAGFWKKVFSVTGGKTYRFRASFQGRGIALPRRSIVAEVHWRDADGRQLPLDEQPRSSISPRREGARRARVPHDAARPTVAAGPRSRIRIRPPRGQTTPLSSCICAWAPGGEVSWGGVSLTETGSLPARTVRLATVHFKPSGGRAPADNCRMYEPLIAEAARRRADLVVLGETLTYVGLGKSYADVAEPVPGPSTEYFGRLARQHNMYIVPGLLERDGHLVYNVAVLIGPDGHVVGKYRKVCLPRAEIDGGVTPGSDYPVFPTRFGNVGPDGLLRRFLPGSCPRAEQSRGRGHRLARVGL